MLDQAEAAAATSATDMFSMKFAPHPGLSSPDAGDDPVDQITFMADQGFTAVEDNWMKVRDVDLQRPVGQELERLGMDMGVIVNTMRYNEPTFVLSDLQERERQMQDVRNTAEVARRVGAKFATTLSGTTHGSLPFDYQTENMIENLKWAGDVAEKEGIIFAVEPINHKGWEGAFLTDVGHTYLILKTVSMPSVKALYDFWHLQIHGGDLIENLELACDEIGCFQIADTPGRVEPGVGEINYRPTIRKIAEKGLDGIIGMEFDNPVAGVKGETAVIDAMRDRSRAGGQNLVMTLRSALLSAGAAHALAARPALAAGSRKSDFAKLCHLD